MAQILDIRIFPVILTLLAYQIGLVCQKKFRTPLCNPILVAVGIVFLVMVITGLDLETYKAGVSLISWLTTPATICLAVPMYEQMILLRQNIRGILAGIVAGSLSSLAIVLAIAMLAGFDQTLAVSLLPKSVTSAIGVPLAELYGGVGSITTPVIILTGIVSSILSLPLCRIFRIRDPFSMGVAIGTSGHVVATAKAIELDPLTGAVSSLSLVIAGLLTSLIFPLVVGLL